MNRYPLCVFFLLTDFRTPHNIFFSAATFVSMKSSKMSPKKMFYQKTFLLLQCFFKEFFCCFLLRLSVVPPSVGLGRDVYFYFGRIACVPDALVSFLSLLHSASLNAAQGSGRFFLLEMLI